MGGGGGGRDLGVRLGMEVGAYGRQSERWDHCEFKVYICHSQDVDIRTDRIVSSYFCLGSPKDAIKQ